MWGRSESEQQQDLPEKCLLELEEEFLWKEGTEIEKDKYDDEWLDEELPQPEFAERRQELQTETDYCIECDSTAQSPRRGEEENFDDFKKELNEARFGQEHENDRSDRAARVR
mmetsp:Transcript_7774/g.28449  ORF Transcript_7774/g.28449 Transcript_7774/m.28449 type:complete len:113 (+) Transcript_7774:1730-2068(+)